MLHPTLVRSARRLHLPLRSNLIQLQSNTAFRSYSSVVRRVAPVLSSGAVAIRPFASKRAKPGPGNILRPLLAITGVIVVGTIVLTVGGIVLLVAVTVGGVATLYYLGKSAYYQNFGKAGPLSTSFNTKGGRPSLLSLLGPLAVLLGRSIAAAFSREAMISQSLQSVLVHRLQTSKTIRSHIGSHFKVGSAFTSTERLVNDRFDMEVVFPVLPKAKEGPYDSDSDSDDDNTVAHALFISATADVSGDAMKTLVDYDSDDDEGTLDIPLAVTTAKLQLESGPQIDITESVARETITYSKPKGKTAQSPDVNAGKPGHQKPSGRVIDATFTDKSTR